MGVIPVESVFSSTTKKKPPANFQVVSKTLNCLITDLRTFAQVLTHLTLQTSFGETLHWFSDTVDVAEGHPRPKSCFS